MDEASFVNMFANGTYDISALKGKRFDVEILTGFVDIGFNGHWTKHFRDDCNTGYNILNKQTFGLFKIKTGVWNGYNCIMLDYGPGFISVKDYIRQIGFNTWLGVYEVGGALKGWFRLREVGQ